MVDTEISLIIFFAAKDGEALYSQQKQDWELTVARVMNSSLPCIHWIKESAKTILGADCGSDHELLIAKFRLKLNKVEKTTRPFRYDLNQIPYDYTVEVEKQI